MVKTVRRGVKRPRARIGRVRGQGAYARGRDPRRTSLGGFLRNWTPSGTLGAIGSAAGGALGGPVGGIAGGVLGGVLSKLTGFGDYAVKMNSLVNLAEGQPVPTFENLQNATVVSHREFISDVTNGSTVNFNLSAFPINPGIGLTFPWLAQIAASYDQYRFLGLVFEFKSAYSDGTSGPLGSVIMSTEYDSLDANYADKLKMENAQYTTTGKPTQDLVHPVECDPRVMPLNVMNIRNGPVGANDDLRFYDLGKFQLATQGQIPSTGVIGELWVSYEVALFKPQISPLPLVDHLQMTGAVTGTEFGTVLTPTSGSRLGGTFGARTYTFPRNGKYMMVYAVTGASGALAVAPAITGSTGVTLLSLAGLNALTLSQINIAAAGETAVTQGFIAFFTVAQVAGSQIFMSWTGGTIPGTVTQADCYVMQLPDGIN